MKVTYSPRAVGDLTAIADFLVERCPAGAQAVERAIRATVKLIADTIEPSVSPPVTQLDLFSSGAASAYRPDPDKVRARLHRILDEARAAESLPWERARVSLYRTIFPQLASWLPEDEGARLRFEFETELERLKAA